MDNLKKCLWFVLVCFPGMLYAQSEVVQVAKVALESDVPLWEKFLLGIFGLVFISIGIFLWKGLPKVVERSQRKKDVQLDEKIKNAEDIEIESNRLIKEVKTTIDKLVSCHEENQVIVDKHDKDINDLKTLLRDSAADKMERHKELDEWRLSIENKLQSILTSQSDHGHFIRTVSVGTLENMLDNALAEIEVKRKGGSVNLKRVRNGLKAFLKLMGLKRNSYNLKNGYALIIEFKADFEYVFNEFAREDFEDIEIIDKDYFRSILNELSLSFYGNKLQFSIKG